MVVNVLKQQASFSKGIYKLSATGTSFALAWHHALASQLHWRMGVDYS